MSIKNYEVKENNPKEELALENSYSEPDVKSFLLSNVRDWKRVPITLRMKNWELAAIGTSSKLKNRSEKEMDVVKEDDIENATEV